MASAGVIAQAQSVTLLPAWTQQNPPASLSARSSAATAYDASNGQLVLFGGYVCGQNGSYPLNDTWTWNGTVWTQLSLSGSPSARGFATMSYDAATYQMVLFGGIGSDGGNLGDTWTLHVGPVNMGSANVCPSGVATPAPCSQATTLWFDVAAITSGAGTPTGVVMFVDGATPIGIGTIASGVASLNISILAVGTHSVTAVYGGDQNFLGATSSTLTELVEDFSFNISAPAVTALPGGTAAFTFTVTPIRATTFPANITLSASGLPQGATYAFSPATLTAGEGATTVTLTIEFPTTQAGAASMHPDIRLAKSSLGMQRSNLTGRLAPLSLALILLPFAGRLRRAGSRMGRTLSVMLLLAAGIVSIAGISGCGSSTGFFAQQQQAYSVTVTGTSGALSHSATVLLTVE